MPAPVEVVATIFGFGLVIFAGARLNRGAPMDFSGLFAARGRSDWPYGVQEGDAPHFEVAHLESLRPPGSSQDPSVDELDVVAPATLRLARLAWDLHRPALKR